MRRFCGIFLALFVLALSPTRASEGIRLGAGFDYIPVANLKYESNSQAKTEIFDNIIWQGRASYDFGNGLKSGILFDYLSKSYSPGPFRKSDLTLWGIGLTGDYGYELTDTGHALLVVGSELGYAHLTDESGGSSGKAGSFWIAGIAGLRFLIFRKIWLESDYRLAFQEFGPLGTLEKKYLLSGSGLRLFLEYPI